MRRRFVRIPEGGVFHAEGIIRAKAGRCEREPAGSVQGTARRQV